MRFLDVDIVAFGALRNLSLSFAPKFTVFYGLNEAGKSTSHAALNAAFCGLRRTRGQSQTDEDFVRQYRPWDTPDTWEVRVTLLLRDGRKIELRQELIDRVDCHAIDVESGRDYTNEIISEGSPDGSVWLGLDRRIFAATACVKQTELLEVLSNPGVLQTHLQRAAAACAAKSTGATALHLIETYRAECVGEDRAASRKPLRRAIQNVEAARASLNVAIEEHCHYLDLIAAENAGKTKLDKRRRELNLARAIISDRDASDWERRLGRAQQILKNHPKRPSEDLDRLTELMQDVTRALRIWQERPALPDLSGHTAAEIEAELNRLPAWPEGDLEPDAQVLKAEGDFIASKYALTLHAQAEPAQPVFPETAGLSVEQIRQLCSVMAEPHPEVDPRLKEISQGAPLDERLVQRVYTAIEVWEKRPAHAEVSSPTATEIRREIETLPVPSEGDLQPASDILDAANTYFGAREAFRQHAVGKPSDAGPPNVQSTTPSELRMLALRLREPTDVSSLGDRIRQRSAAKSELSRLAKSRSVWMGALGVVNLLALIPFLLLEGQLRLMLTGGVMIGTLLSMLLVWRWKTAPIASKLQELEDLQQGNAKESVQWNRPDRDLLDRLDRLQLPHEPETLEALATEIEQAQDADRVHSHWKETNNRLASMLQTSANRLQSRLSEKNHGDIGDVEEAFTEYQKSCAERSRTAALASRRMDLERQLSAKIEAEASAAEINQRRSSADAELRAVGALCGITESEPPMVQQLHQWLDECSRVKVLQTELSHHIFAELAWKQRQLEMREQVQAKGFSSAPADLRRLADDVEHAHLIKAAYEQWSGTLGALTKDYQIRADELKRLIENKGLDVVDEDFEHALRRYREECSARSRIAAESRRRQDLESQWVMRKQAEEAAAEISSRRKAIEQELLTVARRCSVASDEDVRLVESLRNWMDVTAETVRSQQEGIEQWKELDTLFEGRTIQDFKSKVEQIRSNAVAIGTAFSTDELDAARPNLSQHEANVAELTTQTEAAAEELANIQGQIRGYEGRRASVSDAEEDLSAAEQDLATIRLLDDTLETTHAFLTQAQEHVHKDIAPFLADTIRRWLPEITLGRYLDVRVDIETLQVQVCDQVGKWRDAALLSNGTAEQIYLLLRLAMAEYLTKPSEICPLILDDIAALSDVKRKDKMMVALKAISETRQVILFTSEEEVFRWARQNLREPDNRVLELAAAAGTTMRIVERSTLAPSIPRANKKISTP